MSTTLSVIIVSYNTREITLECLRTLHDKLGRDIALETWVVDNASSDGSVAAIEQEFPAVNIIANTQNRGFGTANNQAMRRASGEFFLLLNSDAFVQENSVEILIAQLQAVPEAAIAAPRLLNQDGSLQRSCWKFPSPRQVWLENLGLSSFFPHTSPLGDYSRWAHDAKREVEFVSGACFLVRREVFYATGGFDENFHLYAEETDWQKRLGQEGWKILFTPEAQVTHLGGASGGNLETQRKFFDGLDRYTRKHHGRGGILLMRGGMIVGCFARMVLFGLLGLIPSRRTTAWEKSRLHSWLLWRQATRWKGVF
jgi:GT2 family glycosyltransferase